MMKGMQGNVRVKYKSKQLRYSLTVCEVQRDDGGGLAVGIVVK